MFERKLKTWQKQEQKTVGVAGVSRGTGTTFCTLMMAYFVRHVLKRQSAIAERNYSLHLSSMGRGEELFFFKGVAFLGGEEVLKKERKKYSWLFLDYGVQIASDRMMASEFSRCSIKFVTASLCLWKQEELFRFVESCSNISGNEEWIYLVPFASSKAVKRMGKQLHRQIYSVAAEKEWYRMSADNLLLWEKILKG